MRRRRSGRLVGVGVLALTMWCRMVVTAGPAAAGTLLAVSSSFPTATTMGETFPAGLTIVNTSSPPESAGPVTLSGITLVPSCGQFGAVDCPPDAVDPGVFQVTEASGFGGACAGTAFSITTVDATQGKLQLVPASPVVLQPHGSPDDTCHIGLRVTVLKRPTKDSQPGPTGFQTTQLAAATATSNVTGATGIGFGASHTTVSRAMPVLTTLATPQTAGLGDVITDTATVTGVSNLPPPTSGVIFTVFADPPGALACTGPSQNLGLVGLTPVGGNPPVSRATSPPVVVTSPGTYRFVVSYIGDANYESLPDSPCGAPGENVSVSVPSGRYTPVTPARIVDTRVGTGGLGGPVGPASTATVQVAGRGGLPATGVSAVAMNVTVTQPTAEGYLTIYPGPSRPLASNLNFTPGKTVPNLVIVEVAPDGTVDMFNSAGSTHVVVDVAGWFSDNTTGNDGRYQPLTPARILDTRAGTGGPAARLGPGASLELQVAGAGGVPPSGAEAVVMNVAATNTTATSYLTVYPTGEARPLAANLNWVAGDTVSNRVIAKLGTGGRVTLYNNAGDTDVVVDVNGWFTDASALGSTTGIYTPLGPARILDTRPGAGGSGGLPAGGSIDVQVTGSRGVPAEGVSAVVFNLTAVTPSAAGYLTVFPTGSGRPLASDLNYAAGEIRPNLVVAKVGVDGKVTVFSSSATDLVIDLAGFFT